MLRQAREFGADGLRGAPEFRCQLRLLAQRVTLLGEHQRQAADDRALPCEQRHADANDGGIDLGVGDDMACAADRLERSEEFLARVRPSRAFAIAAWFSTYSRVSRRSGR